MRFQYQSVERHHGQLSHGSLCVWPRVYDVILKTFFSHMLDFLKFCRFMGNNATCHHILTLQIDVVNIHPLAWSSSFSRPESHWKSMRWLGETYCCLTTFLYKQRNPSKSAKKYLICIDWSIVSIWENIKTNKCSSWAMQFPSRSVKY